MPSPNWSCVTRSPTTSVIVGLSEVRRVAKPEGPERERDEDSDDVIPDVGPAGAAIGPVRFHCRCWSGISSRNRDGGLYEGCPHALRIAARVR